PKRLAAEQVENNLARVAPRFITQGSYAYELVNAPAQPPRQQADLDDGLYIPLSFCENTGSPKTVSRLLIDVVESLLADLARRRGWGIDRGNPNCTRLIIAHDKHIDVPTYTPSFPIASREPIRRGRSAACYGCSLERAFPIARTACILSRPTQPYR